MIKMIIISLIVISYSLLNAGQVIMGYVINSANQEPLPDVNIVVVNQEIGSSTDSYGFFQIELPELISEIFIEASAVGFSKVEKKITKNDLKNTVSMVADETITRKLGRRPCIFLRIPSKMSVYRLRSCASSTMMTL